MRIRVTLAELRRLEQLLAECGDPADRSLHDRLATELRALDRASGTVPPPVRSPGALRGFRGGNGTWF